MTGPPNVQDIVAAQISTEPVTAGRLGKPDQPGAPTGYFPRSVSTGLFAFAAVALIGAGAAFVGVGPFATQANAVPHQFVGRSIVVTALSSTLVVPITTYSVKAEEPGGGPLSYSWAMTATSIPDGLCGTPRVPWTQSGSTVPWSHAMNPPDLCPHIGTDHPVKAEVTITILTGLDKGATAVCDLLGSESQIITSPDRTCTHAPAPPDAVAPAVPVGTTSAPASPSGNTPWSVGLSVLALAAAAGGLATRPRGPTGPRAAGGAMTSTGPAVPQYEAAPPDCSALEAALRELEAQLAEDEFAVETGAYYENKAVKEGYKPLGYIEAAHRRQLANTKTDIARVSEALARCRAGEGSGVVPPTSPRGIDNLKDGEFKDDNDYLDKKAGEKEAEHPTGFDPTPPPDPTAPDDDDDDPRKREEIG